MYQLRPPPEKPKATRVHLLGSGAILREVLRTQEILADRFGIAASVWSVTSYKELRRGALAAERWNLWHPADQPRKSYLEQLLKGESGVFVAASDYMRSVPDMIRSWVPGSLFDLGTDGFGRSESRGGLRRFFEIDAECIAVATLSQLMKRGELKPAVVQKAIRELGIDPEKVDPMAS